MPLTMLTRGQEGTVKKITGKDEVRAFLKSLGFVEGGRCPWSTRSGET